MKKLVLFICFFFLFGCTVGNFKENRVRLHEKNNNEEYCQKNPDRCIHGVPW